MREVRDIPINIPSIAIKEPEVPKPPTTFVVSPTNFSSPGETSRRTAGEKASILKESSFVLDKMPSKRRPKLKLP